VDEHHALLLALAAVIRKQLGKEYKVTCYTHGIYIRPKHMQVASLYFEHNAGNLILVLETQKPKWTDTFWPWPSRFRTITFNHHFTDPELRELVAMITGK
jgi:hypothetical protein